VTSEKPSLLVENSIAASWWETGTITLAATEPRPVYRVAARVAQPPAANGGGRDHRPTRALRRTLDDAGGLPQHRHRERPAETSLVGDVSGC